MSVESQSAGERWWLYVIIAILALHIWLLLSFRQLLNSMQAEKADLFLASLASSAEQTLQASHYLEERIVASLRQIADTIVSAPSEKLTGEWLESLRAKHDLKAICIYDQHGKVRLAHDPALLGTDLPLDYGCHDVLAGTKNEHVFGFSSGVFCETDAFGMAVKLPDGGALRLLTGVDFVLGFEKNVGLVPLIARFREYPGVRHLDLVDAGGHSMLGEPAARKTARAVITRDFILRGVRLGRFELSLQDKNLEELRIAGYLAILTSCFFFVGGMKLLQNRLKRRSELAEEQRKAEETRRRIDGFARVVAAVAHEVRNPLNTMSLTVSAARGDIADGRSAAELEPRLAIIEQTIRQADQMIRDLLQAGRPIVVQKRRLQAAEWLKEITDTFMMTNSDADIEIDVASDRTLWADPDLTRQVIWNLLLNARQAGARKIRIQCRAVAAGVCLAVSNDGPEITPEIMAGLFVPGNTTRSDGFGLGLHVCQRICVAQGGTISTTTSPAETEFRVVLPMEEKS